MNVDVALWGVATMVIAVGLFELWSEARRRLRKRTK